MAGEPIKFRCFQCQKLLGVSRTKAGAVVSCPKCGAGLLVPELSVEGEPGGSNAPSPLLEPSREQPEADATPNRFFADLNLEPTPLASSISAGVADFSGVIPPATFPIAPISSDPPVAFPEIQIAETSLRPEPWRRSMPPLYRDAEPNSKPDPPPAPGPAVAEASHSPITVAAIPVLVPTPRAIPSDAAAAAPASPAPETIPPVNERLSGRRRDDVVLPRIVVMLWSFFVVLALGFAFGAGLLWGYYLWVGRSGGRP